MISIIWFYDIYDMIYESSKMSIVWYNDVKELNL